jgi:hypothetical protein
MLSVLASNPEYYLIHFALGSLKLKSRKDEEAASHFKQCL